MKKKMLGMMLFSVLLIASMIFVSSSVVDASETNETTPVQENQVEPTEFSEEDIAFSEKANAEFNALVSYWGEEYPTYYAGSFIADRKFTILVTCDPQEVQEEIWNITGDKSILISKVANTYDDLKERQNQISELVANLQAEDNNIANLIVGVGVDEIQNDVFVEVLNMDDSVRKEVEALLSPYGVVRLISKDTPYQEMSNVKAGTDDWLGNNTTGTRGSIGFCASRVNSSGVTEIGFVTAGHCGNLTNTMTISGTSVGKVSWRKFGGNCDACFVNMNDYPNSGYVRSRILSTYYSIGSYTSVGVVGTIYAMHGKTTGIYYGTVDNTSFSFTMDGVSFSDHIRMKFPAAHGDSGGPLVAPLSGNTKTIVGICSGSDGTYSNFSKVTKILSSMNGSLY